MNKKTIALASLAILGVSAFAGNQALAYKGDPSVKGPNYSAERHTEMTKAFEQNDYQAWKDLMNNKGRVTSVINEGNFAKFAEAHKLALAGDIEGAKEIRKELGLGLQNGAGQGNKGGFGRGMNKNRVNQ